MSCKQEIKVDYSGSVINRRTIIMLMIVSLYSLISSIAVAQRTYTLAEAIEFAQKSSPDIKKSKLNLFSNRKSLDAERASLKSRFSLDVTPINYNQTRTFEPVLNQWNTYEDINSYANFSISQPIAATNGTISLNRSTIVVVERSVSGDRVKSRVRRITSPARCA